MLWCFMMMMRQDASMSLESWVMSNEPWAIWCFFIWWCYELWLMLHDDDAMMLLHKRGSVYGYILWWSVYLSTGGWNWNWKLHFHPFGVIPLLNTLLLTHLKQCHSLKYHRNFCGPITILFNIAFGVTAAYFGIIISCYWDQNMSSDKICINIETVLQYDSQISNMGLIS